MMLLLTSDFSVSLKLLEQQLLCLLTVVCSSAWITTIFVTVAVTSVRWAAAMGQHDVVLPPPLIPMDTIRGVVSLATVPQQQPHSLMYYQAYAHYAKGPPQESFQFQNFPPISLCCVFVMLFDICFRSKSACHFHQWGLITWGMHHHIPSVYMHGSHMCLLVLVHGS